ncbi:Tannase/feruloyl esterase [Halenospora varia]|nr:Tannase/feruloyl esterase [Halenospora varia]
MHGSTVSSKLLIEAYYGSGPKYSYFSGYSVGGRQGLKALKLFPEEYDGVVAGAPAWFTTRIQLFAFKATTYNAPTNSSHTMPEAMFPVINEEVIRQCDGQDGLVDRIISDPLGCNFNPITLLCMGSNTTNYLTRPQIDTLNAIHSDWVNANQTFVFNHFLLGSEATWSEDIGDGSGQANQLGYVQGLLEVGLDFTYKDLTYDTVLLSESINPENASADYCDISPFYKAGGKLIHYHGLADSTYPPGTNL